MQGDTESRLGTAANRNSEAAIIHITSTRHILITIHAPVMIELMDTLRIKSSPACATACTSSTVLRRRALSGLQGKQQGGSK